MAGKLCGAKTRAGGECQCRAMPNGRCDKHGGKSLPPGPSHPSYKHGRTSKTYTVPTGLQAKYAAALDDPDLLDMRRDVALIQTLIEAQMEGIDKPRLLLESIKREWGALLEARGTGDMDAVKERMQSVGALIMSTQDRYPTAKEIIDSVCKRATIAEKQTARMMDQGALLTVAQATKMLQEVNEALDGIIARLFPGNVEARRRLGEAFAQLVLGRVGRPVRSAIGGPADGPVVVAGTAERKTD